MATIIGSLQSFGKLENESWTEHDARTKKLMEELWDQSDNLPKGQVVGGIISFPVADGHAYYQVVKEKPLQLAHVNFMDGWHANPITIRGLKLADVKLMLSRDKAMPKLKPMVDIPSPQAAMEAFEQKVEANPESHELTPFKTLHTRPDGQVFGISHTSYGEWQSVVPSDLADKGEGYQHNSESEAESYLWELIYKEINVDERFMDAISNAKEAFWSEIVKAYPEIESGDLGPDVVIPLEKMMGDAVAAWLKANAPEETDVKNLVLSDLLDEEDALAKLETAKQVHASNSPGKVNVAQVRETYPVGTRIRLEYMPEDPDPIPYGTQGVVEGVDDAGQLLMKWDNGSTLSLIPGVDQFGVVKVSFEDFIATKKWSDDVEKSIGFDNGGDKIKGYIYRDCLYIEQLDDGTYHLPIERDEYTSPQLVELEKTLYQLHFSLIGY